jgi:hypothetical protein
MTARRVISDASGSRTNLTLSASDGRVTIALDGPLDASVAARVRAAVEGAEAAGVPVEVDLPVSATFPGEVIRELAAWARLGAIVRFNTPAPDGGGDGSETNRQRGLRAQ